MNHDAPFFVRSASLWKSRAIQSFSSSTRTTTAATTTNQWGAWLSGASCGGALLLFVWCNTNAFSRACCTHAEASNATVAAAAAAASNQEEHDEHEDDPYANLPEHDEETDCSMCRTFRQGPCRPYWRKLERCFKDHSPKNDDEESQVGTKCVRYFSPHQECLSRYINLYQLIDLHQTKQPLVDETEAAMADHERQYWPDDDNNSVRVDWSAWREFGREMGPSYSQTLPRIANAPQPSKLPPLWKRLPDNVEPLLVATQCTVPMTVHRVAQQGLILKYAYAIDQDGFVIGLSYNRLYGDLLEQAKGTNPNDKDDDEIAKDKGNATAESSAAVPLDLPPTFEFTMFLLPGETQTVRIVGMYFENPLQAPPDKTILDAVLYKTAAAYSLLDMMQNDNDNDDDGAE
jgi:hypothetical protein